MRFRSLSLHPATVGWRVPWPALSELAKEAGYDGAVIPAQQPLPVAWSGEFPVRATAMQLPAEVRKDEDTFRSTFARLEDGCEFAARAGCKVALLGIPSSSDQPQAEQSRLYRERLKRCCEVLDKYSIRLALECITPLPSRRAHAYEFIWHNDEMLEFGLTISPHMGLVVDSWHWHHAGAYPEWIANIPADRILDVHLSDSPASAPEDIRDSERKLPGEGVVDFQLFFDLLDAKLYSGAVAVEIFGGLLHLPPEDAARVALQATRAMFAKIGGATSAAP